jgi:hypothetical protein
MATTDVSIALAFEKRFKTASAEIKSRIQKAITDGAVFCCMNMNICIEVNDTSPEAESGDKLTLYANKDYVDNWLRNLILEELKTKELNPKALEQMRLKGIQPKKQPHDILLIIIVPSAKNIHIGISEPVGFDEKFNIFKFVREALTPIKKSYHMNSFATFTFVDYPTDSEVKEIDNTLTLCFNQLKADGIYIVEESDDEYVNYLED